MYDEEIIILDVHFATIKVLFIFFLWYPVDHYTHFLFYVIYIENKTIFLNFFHVCIYF